MGHAKALLAIDDVELRKQLGALIIEKQLTVRETEKESRKLSRHNKENRL